MPLYLKQTPAIIPQRTGIVILSGCKRLVLWSPARPHWWGGSGATTSPRSRQHSLAAGPVAPAVPRPGQGPAGPLSAPQGFPTIHRAEMCPFPRQTSPWPGPPGAAQAGACTNLLVGDGQTHSQEEKKGAESPNLASAGSQPWQEVEGSTTSIPETSKDSAPCIPALPWGYPHPGCSRERPGKPEGFATKDQSQKGLPTVWH